MLGLYLEIPDRQYYIDKVVTNLKLQLSCQLYYSLVVACIPLPSPTTEIVIIIAIYSYIKTHQDKVPYLISILQYDLTLSLQ